MYLLLTKLSYTPFQDYIDMSRTRTTQQPYRVPVAKKSSPEALIYGVTFAMVIASIFYIATKVNNATPMVENYSNFGSVGHKLQGYQNDIRSTGKQVLDPSVIPRSASSAISASSAVVLADMTESKAIIDTPSIAHPSQHEGSVMDDIKYATKGDGQIRPVVVNRNTVTDELVKLAMFENQDFMYRVQAEPLPPLPHLLDPSIGTQKSMFRKMTYPLVTEYYSKDRLGTDVMREKDDTRVTISFSGGRSPN